MRQKLLDTKDVKVDELLQREKRDVLEHALDQLAEQERNYVYAHFIEGMTLSEIARNHRRPLGSVCSIVYRALPKLRQFINLEPDALRQIDDRSLRPVGS